MGKRIVPRLRFPEFRGTEGWEKTTLGLIADFYKGRGISKSDIDPEGSLPCIRYGELYTRYTEIISTVHSMTSVTKTDLFFSLENDVIIPASGETKEDIAKASCVMIKDVALGSDLNIIRTKQNGMFLSYYLNGVLWREIAKKAQGDTVVHLYPSQLELLALALPVPHEQQKIADCLSSLDRLIAAQGRKVEALKDHKRGLMQELFPREGETVPRLRFPEFKDGPEWKVNKLANVCQMRAGTFISSSKIFDKPAEGLYPCYGGNGLRGYTENYTHSGKFPLIGRQGALCGNIKLGAGKFYATEHAVVVTPNKGIDLGWLFYALDILNLNRFATGQAQPGLSVEVLEKIPIAIPDKEPEQRHIASCLSSLDAQIAAESNKLESLKTHKKGLMQRLFPAPEGG